MLPRCQNNLDSSGVLYCLFLSQLESCHTLSHLVLWFIAIVKFLDADKPICLLEIDKMTLQIECQSYSSPKNEHHCHYLLSLMLLQIC